MSFKSINDKLKHMDQIRFIEIEAADLYYSSIYNKPIEIKNSEYEFNEKYSDIVPPNLDLYYLESKNKLTLKKLGQECYSDVFVNVSFKYPDSGDYTIKNISFTANKGETVAIIGATGSGKSTQIPQYLFLIL